MIYKRVKYILLQITFLLLCFLIDTLGLLFNSIAKRITPFTFL